MEHCKKHVPRRWGHLPDAMFLSVCEAAGKTFSFQRPSRMIYFYYEPVFFSGPLFKRGWEILEYFVFLAKSYDETQVRCLKKSFKHINE